jgi:nicotinate phosphoribosyltransferase
MSESLLASDGYKFSMAEAGWPLRREVFYYSHRKGGFQVQPVDIPAMVRAMMPTPTAEEYAYLAAHDYEMGAAFKAAICRQSQLSVVAIPQGSWFWEREPVFTLSGPSALVSWLEPLVLMLNFRIQVATAALEDQAAAAAALGTATCERQREIILETLDWAQVEAFPIKVDSQGYHDRVHATVKELVQIVGDPARIFEVGMRAASCMEQHEIALTAMKAAGVTRTSNVYLAAKLGLVPVGTMGHEHVQRYGSDSAAFRAMRDRRPRSSSFLLDTFDTLQSGLPNAFALIAEERVAGDAIRYDSGDKAAQYRHAVRLAREMGITPVHVLEDGFDASLTRQFEVLRQEHELAPQQQVYGYGGYIVARPAGHPLTRDRVSAVWKLSKSGPTATMKFADELGGGKESVPGEPIVFRRTGTTGPIGIVGQLGENPPAGYTALSNGSAALSPRSLLEKVAPEDRRLGLTPATQSLVDTLRKDRASRLQNA